MDIRECYQKMDGAYDKVLQRLGKESFIKRLVLRFPEDTSFQMIQEGIASGDVQLAFRGAHTLKGVCANLDFTKLYEESAKLTEILRTGKLEGYEEAFAATKFQYEKMIAVIAELEK